MDTSHLKLCFRENLQTILSYPLSPSKHEITITVEDFKCLDSDQYLNDIIIDFYMKYLTLERLSLKDQKRVHVFNSYFYTCLSQSTAKLKSRNRKLLAAMRHAAVKNWTKHVNIFEKDFIIIPIHKSPCILIFDSLSDLRISRGRVTQELINYLEFEYIAKTGEKTVQCKDLKIIYAHVPQQRNLFDCGLYVLQFAENLFEDFIVNEKFGFPTKHLTKWFNTDLIIEKRMKLKRLLVHLAIASLEKRKVR